MTRKTGNYDEYHLATPEISEHTKILSAAKPKPYTTLRARMTPESRARSEEQTKAILQEMQAGISIGNGQ